VIFIIRMNIELTPQQKEILIGHLLGDGGFILGKRCINPRFVIGRSAKDFEYTLWSSKILHNLLGSNGISYFDVYDKRTKRIYKRITLRTKSLKELLPFFQQWYPENKKIVPSSIKLTPLIVAVWFADDGWISCRKSKKDSGELCNTHYYECGFSTNGFDYDEVVLLRNLLTTAIGVEFHIYKTKPNCKKGYIIRHSTKGTIALINYIKNIFPPLIRKSNIWKKGVDLWKKEWYPKCIFCNSSNIHHIGKNKMGSNQFKCISCNKNYRDVYKQLQGGVKKAKFINNIYVK